MALTLLLQLALIYVSPLQPVFETEPLTAAQLFIVLGASTLGFAAVEVEKAVSRSRARRTVPSG